MATTTESDSAATGGLLVVLGIVVALGVGYAFYHYNGASAPDVNITVPSAPAASQ